MFRKNSTKDARNRNSAAHAKSAIEDEESSIKTRYIPLPNTPAHPVIDENALIESNEKIKAKERRF